MHVVHDESAQRFLIATETDEAVLEYTVDDGRAIFTHTFVPPALRGKGLAEMLVRTGLNWAESSGLKVGATCSYVVQFLERHPPVPRKSGD